VDPAGGGKIEVNATARFILPARSAHAIEPALS
jgi:hypothetical protein